MTNEQNKPQSDAKNPDKNPDMDGNQGEGNRREAKAGHLQKPLAKSAGY